MNSLSATHDTAPSMKPYVSATPQPGLRGVMSSQHQPSTPKTPVQSGADKDKPFSLALRREVQGQTAAEQARSAAEEFVAGTLVLPVLSQLRQTNMAAEPFAPGHYEKSFGPILDIEIAMRMTRAQGFDLVDAVAHGLLRHDSSAGAPAREA